MSPLVVVQKDNEQVRLCIDSRALNTALRREKRPMPTIDDLKKTLAGAKVFSVIELNNGYHQLELAEESRAISTFDTHISLFRHKRLFLGAKSAAEEFQSIIHQKLLPIRGSINMSDNIQSNLSITTSHVTSTCV